jgi:hypothetical protein
MAGIGRISKIAYTTDMQPVLHEPSRQQIEGAFNNLARNGGKMELRYIYEPTENILFVAPAQDYLHPQMRDKVGIPHEKGVSGGFIYPQNLEEMKAKHIQPKDWVRAKNGYRGSLHGADLKENIEPCVNEEQSDPVPIEISPGKTLIPFPGEIEAIAVRRMSKIASFGNGIIKNPQAGVVAKQLENARYHNLRYLEFAGEIFIVDAANLDHGELADEIGLTDNWSVHGASMPFSLRNDYALSGYIYPGDIPAIKSAGLRNWIDDRHHRANLLMISPTRKQLEETNDEYGAVFPRRRGHLAYGDKPLIDPSLQLLEAMLKRSGRPSLRYIIWGGHRYYTTGDKTHQDLADQIGIPWGKQTKEGFSGFIERDDIQRLLSKKTTYDGLARWEKENAFEGAVLEEAEDRRKKAHVAMIDLETTETWENPSKQQLQGILNALKRAGADEGSGQLEFRYVIHSDGMGHRGVTYGIASNTKHDDLLQASGTAKARWPYCFGGMLDEKKLQSCSNTEALREYEKTHSMLRGRYTSDRTAERVTKVEFVEDEHPRDDTGQFVSEGGGERNKDWPDGVAKKPNRVRGNFDVLRK